ncbi:receptor activity-modifying protein 2 [Stegostoma tigrinum]|uniref:receptor activity-modifying protein 2 n=1 Tax=Stegostoma tigrinum TaxID=3053191 RepID=UPI00202B5213|nr:receptor activity-modifying protein 2 [Stegostoma tigrinum]
MVPCVYTIAYSKLILALLLVPTFAGGMTSNTNLYQITPTKEPGSTLTPGSRPSLEPKPGSTMDYAEQGNHSREVLGNNMEFLFNESYKYCGKAFENNIQNTGQQQWCSWRAIASFYNTLTECSEFIMEFYGSYWPNEAGEKLLILMHNHYFKDCFVEEVPTLSDPPENIVLGLITVPISIIPIIVTLVVWCNKNIESNAKK